MNTLLSFFPLLAQTAADPAAAPVWPSVALAATVGLGGLILAAQRGWLQPNLLRHGPERRLDLNLADRAIGSCLLGLLIAGAAMGAMATAQGTTDPDAQQLAATLSAIGLMGSATFFLAKAWMTPTGFRAAGLLPRHPLRDVGMGLLGFLLGTLLTWSTLALVGAAAKAAGSTVSEVNHTSLEQLIATPDLLTVLQLVLGAVIIAPLLEEMVFRGLLQTLLIDTLGRRARWTAVLTASLIFALIHAAAVSWHGWPGLFVLGVVLGWLYERTGSLLPCYLAHALFNAANIAAALGMAQAAG